MQAITDPISRDEPRENRAAIVTNLQEGLLLLLRKKAIQGVGDSQQFFEDGVQREQREQLYGDITQKLVLMFQEQFRFRPELVQRFSLTITGNVDAATAHALNTILRELGAFDSAGMFTVDGTVVSRVSAGIGGLRVVLVDKGVGGDMPLTETVTDERGAYRVTYSDSQVRPRGKAQADLQTRVFAGEAFLGASEVRYNASQHETLNVVLEDAAASTMRSEHEVLTGTLRNYFAGKLADLKETDEQQDLTYLANKTGWDARAVALAALADQFSARTANADGSTTITPAHYYALFRAGLPANEDTLYQVDQKQLESVWTQAAAQGVIPKTSQGQMPNLIQRFHAMGTEKLLARTERVGVSTLTEMLTVSRLDGTQQQRFAELIVRHQADTTKLWEEVAGAFGPEMTKRLQVDGKLGFLTMNNVALMHKVHAAIGGNGLSDPLQLAQTGYHRPEAWNALISSDVSVPKEIPGDTPEIQRGNYASYLAAHVRLSYPTAAIAHMVKSGDVPLTGAAVGISDQVHAFFTEHQGRFEIGVQPIQQYVAKHDVPISADVLAQVKRLQRAYQITASDQALTGLMKHGLDAAHQIVSYNKERFIQTFAADLGGEDQAALTYDRSVQVHNTVLNVVLGYMTARTAPAIGVHSPPSVIDPVPANTGDVIAMATLETMFGSTDFCDCNHCRSILSPAAYLVDLLQFVDQPSPPTGTENPQMVLFERRPDLQHLPLTCENTNTPLPYIDLVNETLEYFIANSSQTLSLKDYHGHDTDDATTEDLLASPQFVLDEAYKVLREARFPPPLPFDQPLEGIRRYFAKFDVPLALAMERLRVGDDLERGANPYGWRDILMEEIGLSPAEHEILTDSVKVPIARLYGFPDGTTDHDVIAGLSNAKRFSRRLGITYQELVDVLKTHFVNPNSDLIPSLERLGVDFALLDELKAKNDAPTDAKFDKALTGLAVAPDPADYGGDIKAWLKDDDRHARIMRIMTLTDLSGKGDACDFGNYELRFSKPIANLADTATRLGVAEFVRVLRFVRLWKKLGWTIEQTDAAVCACYRLAAGPLTEADLDEMVELDAGFKMLLPRLGVIARVMKALNLNVKRDLLPLLSCWSDIGTRGPHSLYQQMFGNPALLDRDPVFADKGGGQFLTDSTKKLVDHSAVLRSAFTMSGDDFDAMMAALKFDANTELSLPNITAMYRRGWLARTLKMSVRELLLYMHLTGLDPFVSPNPAKPAILRLVSFLQSLKVGPLKSASALYLIWNQDLSGKSAPNSNVITEFVRTMRQDFAGIDAQFATEPGARDDAARTRMSLVYGVEASDALFALLDGTVVVDAPYSQALPTLNSAITAADAGIAYDHLRHRLSYRGLVSSATAVILKSIAGVSADFQNAVDELFTKSEAVIGLYFTRYPELKAPYDLAIVVNRDLRHDVFLAAFQPQLIRKRKTQQALQRLSAVAGVEMQFTQSLLQPSSGSLPLHADGGKSKPALDDVLALETSGLAVQFYFRDTATGTPDLTLPATDNLSYKKGGFNPLPQPGSAVSGIWSGQLEAPETGFYNFVTETDHDATITLSLGGQARVLTTNGSIRRNSDPIELIAGNLYEIVIQAEKVSESLNLYWETPKRPRELIASRYLYPSSIVGPFSNTYIRFLKTATLSRELKLTDNEIAYFATRAEFQIASDGWLNALPVSGDSPTPSLLLKPLDALLNFVRIKTDISPDDESLLTALKDPAAATQKPDSLLFAITRWNQSNLNDLLTRLSANILDLGNFAVFRRVNDALALTQTMGISTKALIQATVNDPLGDTVRDLQAALCARYDSASWRDLVRPINDEMRGLQRDALVTYILHQMSAHPESVHIDTSDKLFEYFLMDVQMEPCMQTSRIRHALSSIQLFIERCLMNLEPRVSSAAINAKQWEWMKRYRVWEANRKVFLYPENWLEPELRDDKSPFFKEIESELLQGDITEERAATALMNYLSKLEEVAKLEPCGIHHIPRDDAKRTGEINHVVARSPGASRKYFYRRQEFGYWTPWEHIKLDIEDNPVIPVVWKNRLFLFWLRILKETPMTGQSTTVLGPVSDDGKEKSFAQISLTELKTHAQIAINQEPLKMKIRAVLCWSEFFNGKWQATKTSDIGHATEVGEFTLREFDRSQLWLAIGEASDKLRVEIQYGFNLGGKTWFHLYNTHSAPVSKEEDSVTKSLPFFSFRWHSHAPFTLHNWNPFTNRDLPRTVLGRSIAATQVSGPRHIVPDPWEAPLLYSDSQHAFFVTAKRDPVWLFNFLYYGAGIFENFSQSAAIPPLVLKKDASVSLRPRIWEGSGKQELTPEIVNPHPVERFLTENAQIARAIGTTAEVKFGDRQIGPTGAIKNMNSKE